MDVCLIVDQVWAGSIPVSPARVIGCKSSPCISGCSQTGDGSAGADAGQSRPEARVRVPNFLLCYSALDIWRIGFFLKVFFYDWFDFFVFTNRKEWEQLTMDNWQWTIGDWWLLVVVSSFLVGWILETFLRFFFAQYFLKKQLGCRRWALLRLTLNIDGFDSCPHAPWPTCGRKQLRVKPSGEASDAARPIDRLPPFTPSYIQNARRRRSAILRFRFETARWAVIILAFWMHEIVTPRMP
jgi:hypothetical protein